MKSKEEYSKSIFAKRDALLKKRKRNIIYAATSTAATALLAVFLFTSPLSSRPMHSNEATTEKAKEHSTYPAVSETLQAENFFGEIPTAPADMSIPNDEDAHPFDSNEIIDAMPDSSHESLPSQEENGNFSYEEIVKEAYDYLPKVAKEKCINKDNPEIKSKVSKAEEVYLIVFHTEDGDSYFVTLRQSDLEFSGITVACISDLPE